MRSGLVAGAPPPRAGQDALSSCPGQVKAGALPAVVTSAKRSSALPDVPSLGEFLPGYDTSIWHGIMVPKNTPANIVDKLNKDINAVLTDPKIIERFAENGSTPTGATPADLAKLIADERKWGEVIRAANIKPD